MSVADDTRPLSQPEMRDVRRQARLSALAWARPAEVGRRIWGRMGEAELGSNPRSGPVGEWRGQTVGREDLGLRAKIGKESFSFDFVLLFQSLFQNPF